MIKLLRLILLVAVLASMVLIPVNAEARYCGNNEPEDIAQIMEWHLNIHHSCFDTPIGYAVLRYDVSPAAVAGELYYDIKVNNTDWFLSRFKNPGISQEAKVETCRILKEHMINLCAHLKIDFPEDMFNQPYSFLGRFVEHGYSDPIYMWSNFDLADPKYKGFRFFHETDDYLMISPLNSP